jgi:hypothetical protein
MTDKTLAIVGLAHQPTFYITPILPYIYICIYPVYTYPVLCLF